MVPVDSSALGDGRAGRIGPGPVGPEGFESGLEYPPRRSGPGGGMLSLADVAVDRHVVDVESGRRLLEVQIVTRRRHGRPG